MRDELGHGTEGLIAEKQGDWYMVVISGPQASRFQCGCSFKSGSIGNSWGAEKLRGKWPLGIVQRASSVRT